MAEADGRAGLVCVWVRVGGKPRASFGCACKDVKQVVTYDSSATEADSRNAQVLRPETAFEAWDQTSSPGEEVRKPVPQTTAVRCVETQEWGPLG